MILTFKGNAIDHALQSKTKVILVHGCNCQGRMGSGIALEIKNRFPQVYAEYVKQFAESGLNLGEIIPVKVNDTVTIINAMTQQFYGSDKSVRYVSYDAIDVCFSKINTYAKMNNIVTLVFPLIGAGLANGDWRVISEIIESRIDSIIAKNLIIFDK
jgi:O-acetyl-ADP-ribose deacetylase (regulator of RNase III)